MKLLEIKDLWKQRKWTLADCEEAITGTCPVILNPPFKHINDCLGTDCIIWNKCMNKSEIIKEWGKSKKYELEGDPSLDTILGL